MFAGTFNFIERVLLFDFSIDTLGLCGSDEICTEFVLVEILRNLMGNVPTFVTVPLTDDGFFFAFAATAGILGLEVDFFGIVIFIVVGGCFGSTIAGFSGAR